MASTPNQASLLNLPSVAEIKNLVEDSLTHDWILRIEYFAPVASTSPSRQWRQWGDSLFAIPDASSVIDGIVACRASHPTHCIRLHAEKVNPRTQMYYPVYRPDPSGKEAGMLHHAGVVPPRIIAWVSSLADGALSMRGMAWKITTVAGMLLASLFMLEEVLA